MLPLWVKFDFDPSQFLSLSKTDFRPLLEQLEEKIAVSFFFFFAESHLV